MVSLEKVKVALRLTADDAGLNEEINDLIQAAYKDLNLAAVTEEGMEDDPLIVRAVITYCRLNFGQPDDYDRLKRSYDEQKAQLGMATGYTNFED